jgi:drug/metabolite transporter (DMT)-like permease
MKREREGELFILSEALLWGLFPVITVLSFSGLAPLTSLIWTTFISIFFFAILMQARGRWQELINPALWKYALLITLFIGVGVYGLYYTGLTTTSPGNAALLGLFELATSYLLFNVIRKEHFSAGNALGAVFMVLGAFLVLGKNFTGFTPGDFFILGATVCAPFGNLFQQKARAVASSETVMFLRSVLSTLAVVPLAFLLHEPLTFPSAAALPFILINAVFVFGASKLLWIEGIHRISVTKANVLQSVNPLITLLFAWFILSQAPSVWQLASIVPFFIGVVLLTRHMETPSEAPAGLVQ